MKKYVFMLCVLMSCCFASQAFAQYDQPTVQQAMQMNMTLMGDLNQAVEAKDYFTAAEKLMEIAKVFKSLDEITPPKATKADWNRIHGELIKAAFRGIGACGEENAEKLTAAIAEVSKYQAEGHQMFR